MAAAFFGVLWCGFTGCCEQGRDTGYGGQEINQECVAEIGKDPFAAWRQSEPEKKNREECGQASDETEPTPPIFHGNRHE